MLFLGGGTSVNQIASKATKILSYNFLFFFPWKNFFSYFVFTYFILFFFIVSLISTTFFSSVFIFLSEKQRIDSGYYLYQAGWKIKKEKEERKSKKVYSNLGAMFAVDQKTSSTESSSNSDEDFDIHHAKKWHGY